MKKELLPSLEGNIYWKLCDCLVVEVLFHTGDVLVDVRPLRVEIIPQGLGSSLGIVFNPVGDFGGEDLHFICYLFFFLN